MPVLSVTKSMAPSLVHAGDTVTVCITVKAGGTAGPPQADIYWVFDTTGSMGLSIDNLKTNINAFTSQLSAQGISYRDALIEYKDVLSDVPAFVDHGFAPNDATFHAWISAMAAGGGGDEPESGLEAITISAASGAWRSGASKTMVLITDAHVHEITANPPGLLSLTATARSLKDQGIVINVISPATMTGGGISDPRRLTDTAGGLCFDLNASDWSGLLSALGSSVSSYSHVVIQDPLPPQLLPIPGQLDGATDTAGTLSWTVSDLGAGDVVTHCFLSEVAPGYQGPVANSACAGADDVPDNCGSAVPVYYVTPTPTISPTFTISQTYTISPTFTVSPTITPTPRALELRLFPPNPDPAHNEVWLPFYLNADSNVDIRIYSVAGEPVRDLEAEWTLYGDRERRWDLRNKANTLASSGVYIYRVRAVSATGEERTAYGKCAVTR